MTTVLLSEVYVGVAAPASNYSGKIDMGSEASFDTVLWTRDSFQVQQAFECFYASRLLLEEVQALAVRGRVERELTRLQLPVLTRNLELSEYGFNIDIVASYSAFLCQKHGLLGNLIQLHSGKTPLDSRPNNCWCLRWCTLIKPAGYT
jgi:hypothetical protein